MRCVIYGLVLIISCYLIEYTEAQSKNYKKSKVIESVSGERYTKHKEDIIYKSNKHKYDDIESGEYKINKYDNWKCKSKGCGDRDVDPDLNKENKNSKFTKKIAKYADDNTERSIYKRNKEKSEPKMEGSGRKREFKVNRKKALLDEGIEDSVEDFTIVKKQKKQISNEGFNKKMQLKVGNQNDEDKILKEERNKETDRQLNKHKSDVNDNETDSKEDILKVKFRQNVAKRIRKPIQESEENYVQINKNKMTDKNNIKKQYTSSEHHSSEETNENDDESEQNDDKQSDESYSNEKELEKTCKKKSKGRRCCKEECGTDEHSDECDECDEANDALIKKKKIKYSIKFAHEKQKINPPSEDDHVMKKIHKGKKKFKYGDDDAEDSSEEHIHPKRFQFVDEDNED